MTATAPEIKYRPGAYLLHFCQPLGDPTRPRACARHYVGASKSVGYRIDQHNRSEGCGHIVHIANQKGIIWCVAYIQYTATAKEAFDLERRWKRNGHHADLCPICKERTRP